MMNKKEMFSKWIHELFKDERELVSVKPVIAVAGALCLIVGMILSLFIKMDPADILVDGVVIITCVGMGADTLDKFSFKTGSKTKKKEEEPEV